MYLIAPMDPEPPPEYVAFVADHLRPLRRETERLVGGDPEGAHLYMDVLADLAGHWRRLAWQSWLRRRDVASEYLLRRLTERTRQWRDEQIYEVDVRVVGRPASVPLSGPASLALRKAALLPGTARSGVIPVADASIAWVHAYRRHQWRRIGRLVTGGILLIGGMVQYMSWLSTGS
ncbi:hypothetical protein ACWKSP_03225 [Micromonosporaceae bacterium Da 78-11]